MTGFARISLLAASLVGLAACTKSTEGKHEAKGEDASAQAEAEEAEESGDTGEGTETWAPAAVEIELAVDSPESEASGNTIPTAAAEPSPLSVEWTSVAELPTGEAELLPFTTGVLVRADGQLYELDKGELVARPDLELPEGELFGDWPRDAWVVERTARDAVDEDGVEADLRLLKYKKGKWREQKRGRSTTVPALPGQELRRGWRAGFLIREDSHVSRLGSQLTGPRIGPRMGKQVLAIVETRSGKIYNLSLRKNTVFAQRNCQNFKCVEEHAIRLPFGKNWRFGAQAPRQRNSVSMVANVENEGAVGHYLLHYEIGGWKLESFIHEPEGLWPTAEGGLWVLVKDSLRYRSTGGDWFEIELPEGVDSISAAMARKPEQLVVAAEVGGKAKLFATAPDPGVEEE